MSRSRHSLLINSPDRIFDHSTIHGRIHSCLYRMPWNLILPLSALAFIVFLSAVSIKSGLEQVELYKGDRNSVSDSSIFDANDPDFNDTMSYNDTILSSDNDTLARNASLSFVE